MRTSVERFRIGLLVGAVLLVLVIAGFLGYARWRVHRALVELPGRLGATITKEFNGYTYSQSDGKKTIFTIHAAKAVQHTDGKYSLHDVSMVLYGHKGDRADRISGSDFEYDTKEEVIRAVGLVHLDLQAPTPAGEQTSDAAKHLDPGATLDHVHDAESQGRIIHVKTSGLVYVKKLGIAATSESIEFAFGGFTGHAVGAEFNSDTGHLVLQSAITVSGLDRGQPVSLAASHGELDRAANQAHFLNARYNSAEESAQAETAIIHMRPDDSVERIEGERQVLLERAGQGKVTADHATVTLTAASKPSTAVLTGTVRFTDDEPFRQAHGESDRATLDFDELGRLQHTVLSGHVRTNERSSTAAETKTAWPERNLEANSLEMFLASEAGGKPQLHQAVARGSARLSSIAIRPTQPGKRAETTTTKLNGDSLQANFLSTRGTTQISTVHGAGHTVIDQLGPTGVHQTSSGDMLDVAFRETSDRKGSVEVATAVQQGGVIIDRTVPAIAEKPADTQHATTQKAAFDADTNLLTLTGKVQMNDAGSALWADRVVVKQDSGNATADGTVKMTYAQSGASEPVHVLAARAELDHDAVRATFHGSTSEAHANSKLARLWQSGSNGQGGSQIEAPVLVFEQQEKRLTARSEKPLTTGQVHAVLASATTAKADNQVPADPSPKIFSKTPVRITSSQLVYSDMLRQAEFTGGVRVFDANGEMQAQTATAFLTPASDDPKKTKTTSSNPAGLLGGSVERIVASQHVELTQPGRRATGDRLVYTASDQMFVLTGTPTAPPKVVDAIQGTTTGASLRFHSGGDSIAITGTDGDGPARKVHTETRVKQ